MGRIRNSTAVFAAVLAALVARPAPASAFTVDGQLDVSTALLNQSTAVNGEVVVTHDGSSISNNVILTGTLPQGFSLNNVNIVPTVILGEMSYNTYDQTRLMTIDVRNGDLLDGLQVVLQGVPEASQACGIYGFDVNPISGEYYALIGLQPPGDTCYYASSVRDLFKIDPKTGLATWLGSPPVKLNGLTFSPNGQLFGHGSNGAPRRGGLYKVSTVDGATSSFVASPIAGAAVTWNDSPAAGANPVDGLLYHFYDCEMATTRPDNGTQTAPIDTNTGNCPDDDYMVVSYMGGSKFLILSWNDIYLYDVALNEWDYQSNTEDVRGGVGAGLDQTFDAACDQTGTTFTCTIPRLIPRGRYIVEFDGNFTPTSLATASFDFKAGDAVQSKTIQVVAADLLAFAKADKTRVDTTDTVVWTVEAENLGTSAAANSQLVVTLPANQAFSSYTSSQGSCSHNSGVVTCNLGSVAGGILARVKITTTAGVDGISEIDVSASTSSGEASSTNNTTTARVIVGPAADLAVSASLAEAPTGDTSATVASGKSVKLNFVVENKGPAAAADVKLYHRIPAKMELASASAKQGTCAVSSGQLVCNLGTIPVDGSVSVELSPTPKASGRFALDVSAESITTPDFDISNNTATLRLDVAPPTVQVAVGPKSPRTSGTAEKAPLAQLVLTHGGQTDQTLQVTSLSIEGAVSRVNLDTMRVLVVDDADGNGIVGADERVIGNGDLLVNGDTSTIRLAGDGVKLEKGQTVTLLIVLRDGVSTTQIASLGGGASLAMLGLLPIMLLFGLRRRHGVALAVLGLVFFGAAACTTEETEAGAKIQLTVTAVEAELAEGGGPAAAVEGLPLALPTVEVK